MGTRRLVPIALAVGVVASAALGATALGSTALGSTAAAAAPSHHVLRHGPRIADDTSDNWAGYAVTGASHSFTSVESHWTQPKVDCSSTGDASWWVGLDGWESKSVEQTGADSVCNGDKASYYAWWEMYPASTKEIHKPVKAGDEFYAKVTYDGGGKYTMYLQDKTQNWDDTEHATSKKAEDDSAEVIFEGVGPVQDDIPKFADVTMSGNLVNGKQFSTLNPEKVNLVRNSNTLVTPGAFDDNGDFDFSWQAAH